MKGEVEKNKKIAVFMGYKYSPSPCDNPGWWKKGLDGEENGSYLCRNHNGLKYNTHWGWLMPVFIELMARGKVNSLSNAFSFRYIKDINDAWETAVALIEKSPSDVS